MESRIVTFTYTNYKGETAMRRVLPHRIAFETTEWHPEPQWFLEAWDYERQVVRFFAMKDIRDWEVR